jgi:hypothetical protein
MAMKVIEVITNDDIEAALSKWTPKGRELIPAFVKGLDMALGKCKFDGSVLAGLEFAIEHGPLAVVSKASLIVAELAEKYDEAKDVIVRLAKAKRVQGRLGAIYSLSPLLSDDFVEEVIAGLISDKSKKIKEMAVDWVGRSRKKQFLPLVRAALEREGDEKMKDFITTEIAYLSDGYIVTRENGTVYVSVALPVGTVGGFFNEPNRDELSDKEIVEIFLKQMRGKTPLLPA